MNKTKFNYLKKYVNQDRLVYDMRYENAFWGIDDLENIILVSESRLGYKFPSGLVDFWKEIGEGSLVVNENVSNEDHSFKNAFLQPKEIADIILLREESGLIIPEVSEMLDYDPGRMPFFEVGDSASFIYMYPQTEEPEAIYYAGTKVAANMEEFVHRLYYESPDFYIHVEEEPEGEARESEDEK